MISELNFCAPINTLSYGIVSYNFLNCLYDKFKINLFNIGQIQVDPLYNIEIVQNSINNTGDFNGIQPCLKIFHQFTLAERIGSGKYYGFPIFELDNFNTKETSHMRCVDTLLVTSEWAKTVVDQNNIGIETKVVNLGVDTDIFFPNNDCTQVKDNDDQYIFLVIGKFEHRKLHNIIPVLFDKAFNVDDNVKLCLMTSNPFLSQNEANKWLSYYKNIKLNTKVQFISSVQSQKDVANIINGCDCLLSPGRAEGWNLPLLESLACGKPCITTNYSAHTEYANSENCFLIEIKETEPAYDGKWFHGQGNWAAIDYDEEEQIIEHMRHCYKNKIRYNEEGVKTAKKFTWHNSAQKLINILNE